MSSVLQAKSMAKALRKAFAARQTILSHSECLELVARQLGFTDWNMLAAAIKDEVLVKPTVFVEHGRQNEAAAFYQTVFGARQIRTHTHEHELIAVELQIGATIFAVSGSNPKREADPSRGGPFCPRIPGAVSAAFNLEVGDADQVLQRALRCGAVIRDALQKDLEGRRVATFFDPFGHIWA